MKFRKHILIELIVCVLLAVVVVATRPIWQGWFRASPPTGGTGSEADAVVDPPAYSLAPTTAPSASAFPVVQPGELPLTQPRPPVTPRSALTSAEAAQALSLYEQARANWATIKTISVRFKRTERSLVENGRYFDWPADEGLFDMEITLPAGGPGNGTPRLQLHLLDETYGQAFAADDYLSSDKPWMSWPIVERPEPLSEHTLVHMASNGTTLDTTFFPLTDLYCRPYNQQRLTGAVPGFSDKLVDRWIVADRRSNDRERRELLGGREAYRFAVPGSAAGFWLDAETGDYLASAGPLDERQSAEFLFRDYQSIGKDAVRFPTRITSITYTADGRIHRQRIVEFQDVRINHELAADNFRVPPQAIEIHRRR